MSITVGTVAVGERIWRAIAPVKLVKQALNKRRKRLGKPLLPLTQDDETMLPNGTATQTGAAIAGSSPLIGLVVTMVVPAIEQKILAIGLAPVECALEAANCVTAGQLAFGLVSGVVAMAGGAIASWGRRRAQKRHEAELAAATAAPAP
jgi:hypothetical protein